MRRVLVIGAGRIGGSVAKMLQGSGEYQLMVVDSNAGLLAELKNKHGIETQVLDIAEEEGLALLCKDREAVVSACPYHKNVAIARSALSAGISYFDLTEDIDTAEQIRVLAKHAQPGQVFVPQCGLAPGFITILACHVSERFDEVDTLSMRVGALPEFPSNQMMYNLTWSTDGLINEYCNPCSAIKDGKAVDLMPLEGLETFSLDGTEYEAFNTSGGLGSLCETMDGKVRNLTYKTIRYPGHQYLMNFLINGLRLGEHRQLLRKIFENAVAMTRQDVVLITVSAIGKINQRLTQFTDSRKIYHQNINDEHWGAIQITTAAGLCAMLDMFYDGNLPQQGFIKPELVPFDAFLENRFGQYFASENSHRG